MEKTMETANVAKAKTQSLVARLATKFGVEPGRLLKCLTCQVFKQSDGRISLTVKPYRKLRILLVKSADMRKRPVERRTDKFQQTFLRRYLNAHFTERILNAV